MASKKIQVVGLDIPQADWNQTDDTKSDYIQNKPVVPTEQDIISLIGEYGNDTQIQSDWNQTDEAQLDYIKNKPAISAGEGENSITGGLDTIASATAQTALGKYNTEEPTALLIIGNGTSDTERSNLFSVGVDENGVAYMTLGGTTITFDNEEEY